MNNKNGMKNNLNKKTQIKAIVGLALFIVIVISASFAYYGISTSKSTTTRKLNSTVDPKLGVIASGYGVHNVSLNRYQLGYYNNEENSTTYVLTDDGFIRYDNYDNKYNYLMKFIKLSYNNTTGKDDLIISCLMQFTIEFETVAGYPNLGDRIFNYGFADDFLFHLITPTGEDININLKTSDYSNKKIIVDYGGLELPASENYRFIIDGMITMNIKNDINQDYLQNARANIKIYPSSLKCYPVTEY